MSLVDNIKPQHPESRPLVGRTVPMSKGQATNCSCVLMATKRYYFGVGGVTDVFREIAIGEVICVDDITCGLSIEKINSYDSGKGNIRYLLQIR